MPLYYVPPLPDVEDAPWLENIWKFYWGDMCRFTPKIPFSDEVIRDRMPEGMDKLIDRNKRALKRDKVFGMCAETRREHREADKRRWYTHDGMYGPLRYNAGAHVQAYADALGIDLDAAYAKIERQQQLVA